MLELQGPSKTPAPKTPAQQGTPGAPHPIGPSSSPSVCSGLYGAARSPAHSLPGGYRLVRHAAAEGTTNASVRTQLSTPSSLRSSSACYLTVPTLRERGCPRCALCRGAPQSEAIPSLALRSLAGGWRGAQKSLPWLIGRLSAGPRAPLPHATTHGRCRGVSEGSTGRTHPCKVIHAYARAHCTATRLGGRAILRVLVRLLCRGIRGCARAAETESMYARMHACT
jgi:hypothetical protein